ncbi:MAG: tetratricopeptide repeat protein [Bacteroidales bacterium]|nr:tetratricopeptide repeat protein [Bacteroidales bacterium]MCF8334410.1 tetratricopeptide repeat protein [Bacteroidales bacterium]
MTKRGVATTLNNLGNLYNFIGEFDSALRNLRQSTAFYEKKNDEEELIDNYINLGDIYMGQDLIKKAFHYFNKALNLAKKKNDLYAKAICLNEIGMGHYHLEEYDFAQSLLKESLNIRHQIDDKRGEMVCLINLGHIHNKLEKYDKANEYYRKALKIEENLDDKRLLANTYTGIGENLMMKGKLDKAINYFKQSIEIARDIGAKPEVRDNYEKLVMAYAKKEDYESSKKYIEAFAAMDDSLRLENIEAELKKMEQKKNQSGWQWHYYIPAAAILILLIVYLFYIIKRRKT